MTGFAIESADPNRPFLQKGDWQYDIEVEKADPDTGIVSGFASIEGVDKAGDMIVMEAFEKALARLKGEGVDLPLALGHMAGINVGKVTDVQFLKESTPRKFWIQGKINKSKAGKAAMDGLTKGLDPNYKGEDAIRAFSIGGSALSKVRYCSQAGSCFNKIDDIELYHIALVNNPMNSGSLIMAVKGSLAPLRKVDYGEKDYINNEGSIILKSDEGTDQPNASGATECNAAPPVMMKVLPGYDDFADCVAKNQDKDNPEAYCGAIEQAVKKKGEGEIVMPDEVKKEEKPVAQPPAQAAPALPTQQPATPTPAPTPAIDYKAKFEELEPKYRELETKLAALDAEKKLNATAGITPPAQAPAPAIGQPANQPDRKGVVQGSGPLSGSGAGVSVQEMARKMNENKAPLVPLD